MDGGRFDVEFENKWFTSVAPGLNLVRTAHYEDPNPSSKIYMLS